MNATIEKIVNLLFEDLAETEETTAIREEVLQNCQERYQDLREAGYQICLATSKPEQFAIQILEHFGSRPCFHHVAGALMDESRNKKSEVIAHALTLCGADTASCLMIGDREYDVLGAKEFSIPTVGVLFGYGSRVDGIACVVGQWE